MYWNLQEERSNNVKEVLKIHFPYRYNSFSHSLVILHMGCTARGAGLYFGRLDYAQLLLQSRARCNLSIYAIIQIHKHIYVYISISCWLYLRACAKASLPAAALFLSPPAAAFPLALPLFSSKSVAAGEPCGEPQPHILPEFNSCLPLLPPAPPDPVSCCCPARCGEWLASPRGDLSILPMFTTAREPLLLLPPLPPLLLLPLSSGSFGFGLSCSVCGSCFSAVRLGENDRKFSLWK